MKNSRVIMLCLIIGTMMVILPIAINFISWCTLPCEKDFVAGNEGDWIGFWGSYIGALLGAGVTFYVLWCESKKNTLNIMIQDKEKQIECLRGELSRSLSSLDFCYLGSISLEGKQISKAVVSEYLMKLNDKHQNATSLYNSWNVSSSNGYSGYNDKYTECYKKYVNCIDKLTRLLALYRSGELESEVFLNKLQEFNTDDALVAKVNYLQPLFDASIQIIDSEVEKKKDMIKELSSWHPNLEKFTK